MLLYFVLAYAGLVISTSTAKIQKSNIKTECGLTYQVALGETYEVLSHPDFDGVKTTYDPYTDCAITFSVSRYFYSLC